MNLSITTCELNDANDILQLYQEARNLQIHKKMVVWPSFNKSFIELEIAEKRQWKLVCNNIIACNWVITFNDRQIWGKKDMDDAIYIHRICTNSAFRGNRYIDRIAEWSKEYAKRNGKKFIRLDTLGDNKKLIEHYTSAGFSFLGMFKLTNTEDLPLHYQNEPNCCLFEIELKNL